MAIRPIRLSKYEQETIIRISADEDEWDIYTSCPSMARKFEKLAIVHGKETHIHQGGLTLKLPKNAVSFRKPTVLTDATREARAQRMRNRVGNSIN